MRIGGVAGYYPTPHCTTPHCTALHCTALHYDGLTVTEVRATYVQDGVWAKASTS